MNTDKLREALDKYNDALTGPWYFPPWVKEMAEAARAVLDAEEREWCEEHGSPEVNGSTCMAWEQAYSETAEPWEIEIDCRMVPARLLIGGDE